MQGSYFNILVYGIFVVSMGLLFLIVSALLGPRRYSKQKFDPYECGVTGVGGGGFERGKVQVPFYLVATFFILFDIETVFLVPWAVSFEGMSVAGIWEMMIFLLILGIGLLYILKKRVIQFDSGVTRGGV